MSEENAVEELPDFDRALERAAKAVFARGCRAAEGREEFGLALKFVIEGPSGFYPARVVELVFAARREGDGVALIDLARQAAWSRGMLRRARLAYLN